MRRETACWIVAGMAALGVVGFAHIGSAAAATSAEERVRTEAEALAEASSQEFNVFLQKQKVAQADTSRPPARADRPADDVGPMGWLRSSGREFQSLMRMLAGERTPVQPWDPVSEAAKRADARSAAKPAETDKAAMPATVPAPAPVSPPAKQAGEEVKRAGADTAKPPAKAESAKSSAAVKAGDTPVMTSEQKRPLEGKATAEPKAPASTPPPPGSKVASSTQPETGAAKKDAVEAQPPASKAAAAPPPAASAKSEDSRATVKKTLEPSTASPAKKTEADAAAPAKKAAAETKSAASAKEAVAPPPPLAPPKSAAAPSPAVAPARGAARPVSRREANAACKGAGRRIAGAGWYTARAGDSLWRIAEAHFGSGMAYRRIRAANRSTIDEPDRIRPCQRIYIPQRRMR